MPEEWQIQPVCKKCQYRRTIYSGYDKRNPNYWNATACHYMIDTDKMRDGRPEGDYFPNFKPKDKTKSR